MAQTPALRIVLPEPRVPTRREAVWFSFRAGCFRLRHLGRSLFQPSLRRYSRKESATHAVVLATSQTDLWTHGTTAAERRMQLGKVQNLRVAGARLDGVTIPTGEIFSFWRHIGRATRRRGFVQGRELREGCLIPSIGGGLCQLSGALYSAALHSGLEIVQRHAHTDRGVSPLAKLGHDATIFWNYVDLRLRAPFPWRLEVRLSADHLTVRITALSDTLPEKRHRRFTQPITLDRHPSPGAGACDSCGVSGCFRHREMTDAAADNRVAVLVDELWPEFDDYLQAHSREGRLLCRPLNAERWRKPNYAWSDAGFATCASATWTTFRRALACRRLREQGAQRQQALLAWDDRLALAYARELRPDHTHLIVSQNLLPFLWRAGVLGGRTFDVLMVRQPLANLHAALDRAAVLHPESRTCADFRAPMWLVEAESAALAAANKWITPHRAVASLAGRPVELLEWKVPPTLPRRRGDRIVFPASTTCRKGAYELRAAMRTIQQPLWCTGGIQEGANFWEGITVRRTTLDWLQDAAVVVLPAFIEHRPRRLLAAVAAGIPVIATAGCGLGPLPGVSTVPEGDAAALTEAIRDALGQRI